MNDDDKIGFECSPGAAICLTVIIVTAFICATIVGVERARNHPQPPPLPSKEPR